MSKTTQRIFRAMSFMGTLACLWLATFANTGSVQALQQGQYGLTLSWEGGDPPRFMCISDYEWMLFVIRFAPDPNLAPLVSLVPHPAGGSLDIKATKGTLDNSHWRLDFRTASQKSGVFRYKATTEGQEDLTLTYNYNDSVNNYTGSTPPVHFRVQRCDYRVKLTLQRDSTVQFQGGAAAVATSHITLTGEGGFRIKGDERNGWGNTPFSGSGATEAKVQAQMNSRGGQVTTVQLGTGQGTLAINGEILENGTLEMDIMLYPVTMSGQFNCGSWGGCGTINPHQLLLDSKYLWSMKFPPDGGTQSPSGPADIQPPGGTSTDSLEVTVSWEK